MTYAITLKNNSVQYIKGDNVKVKWNNVTRTFDCFVDGKNIAKILNINPSDIVGVEIT